MVKRKATQRSNLVKKRGTTHFNEGGVTFLMIEKEAAKMKSATTCKFRKFVGNLGDGYVKD